MPTVAVGRRRLYLGLVAALDLAARLVPQRLLDGLAVLVTDSTSVGHLLSTWGLPPGAAGFIGSGLTFTFLGYVAYTWAPGFHRSSARHLTEARGFRALTAVTSTGLAGWIAVIFPGTVLAGALDPSLYGTPEALENWALPGILAILVAGFLGFFAYLPRATDWTNLSSSERARHVEDFVPLPARKVPRMRSELEGSNPTRWDPWLSAMAAWSVAPPLLLGMLEFAALAFWPVFELLVLTWIGASALGLDMPESRRADGRRPSPLDLERRISEGARSATRSFKGFIGTIVILVGLLLNGIVVATSASAVVLLAGTIAVRPSTLTTLHDAAGLAGVLYVPLLATAVTLGAGYGSWFWLRELDRLPFFLQASGWLHRPGADGKPPEGSGIPTRPVGLLVPTLIAFAPLAYIAVTAPEMAAGAASQSHLLLFDLSLGLIIVLVVAAVYATIRREPQPPRWENVVLPVAFAVQLAATSIAIAPGIPGEPVVQAEFVLVFLLILYLWLLGDVRRIGETRGRARQAAPVVFSLGVALVFAGYAGTGYDGTAVALLAATSAVTGVATKTWILTRNGLG